MTDIIIIGAGPAGLMAAGSAALMGADVLILEKNPEAGRKLLLTGGGRCNITNNKEIHQLVQKYGKDGKRLYSAFTAFPPEDVISFFERNGLDCRTEAEDRVFPVTDSAKSVRDMLVSFAIQSGARIEYKRSVQTIKKTAEAIEIKTQGRIYSCKKLILATGGYARPETGSTGEGFEWLSDLGIDIEKQDPILVPIRTKEKWKEKLMGISFQECGLVLKNQDGSLHARDTGKVLFTHFGLSGPLILNYSKRIRELAAGYKNEKPCIYLDFFPKQDHGSLEKQIIQLAEANPKRKLPKLLAELVPPRLVSVVIELAGKAGTATDSLGDIKAAELPKLARKQIAGLMKEFPMTYQSHLGNDKAIVSSGGVILDEINFKTMELVKDPAIFVCGDMLNFDRPSGGYSLQICWATGWRAGEAAAEALFSLPS